MQISVSSSLVAGVAAIGPFNTVDNNIGVAKIGIRNPLGSTASSAATTSSATNAAVDKD